MYQDSEFEIVKTGAQQLHAPECHEHSRPARIRREVIFKPRADSKMSFMSSIGMENGRHAVILFQSLQLKVIPRPPSGSLGDGNGATKF